ALTEVAGPDHGQRTEPFPVGTEHRAHGQALRRVVGPHIEADLALQAVGAADRGDGELHGSSGQGTCGTTPDGPACPRVRPRTARVSPGAGARASSAGADARGGTYP